jgi:hypothetical protein
MALNGRPPPLKAVDASPNAIDASPTIADVALTAVRIV